MASTFAGNKMTFDNVWNQTWSQAFNWCRQIRVGKSVELVKREYVGTEFQRNEYFATWRCRDTP